jgi:hypothetical protein
MTSFTQRTPPLRAQFGWVCHKSQDAIFCIGRIYLGQDCVRQMLAVCHLHTLLPMNTVGCRRPRSPSQSSSDPMTTSCVFYRLRTPSRRATLTQKPGRLMSLSYLQPNSPPTQSCPSYGQHTAQRQAVVIDRRQPL